MKALIGIVAFAIVLAAGPAHARHHHHQQFRHYAHYAHSYGGSLPGPCYLAARQGGPCGCVAEGKIFGRHDHVLNGWNPWLAIEWMFFPTTAPRPGVAAVWRNGHHVEAVVSGAHGGTVTTDGPYGLRQVSLSAVVIVDPHGARTAHSGHTPTRYAAHHHRRYAHRYAQSRYFAWDRPRRYAYNTDSWQHQRSWR